MGLFGSSLQQQGLPRTMLEVYLPRSSYSYFLASLFGALIAVGAFSGPLLESGGVCFTALLVGIQSISTWYVLAFRVLTERQLFGCSDYLKGG